MEEKDFGLSRNRQPFLMRPPVRIPVTDKDKKQPVPVGKPWVACDSDAACEKAVCAVVIDVAKDLYLYFCLHHYRKHAVHIFTKGYEVNEL